MIQLSRLECMAAVPGHKHLLQARKHGVAENNGLQLSLGLLAVLTCQHIDFALIHTQLTDVCLSHRHGADHHRYIWQMTCMISALSDSDLTCHRNAATGCSIMHNAVQMHREQGPSGPVWQCVLDLLSVSELSAPYLTCCCA